MEKFAILSLVADQANARATMFGRSLIDHLIFGLERSGVRRFLLTGDVPATEAARLVDRIKAKGLGASFHRSLGELDAVLPAEARLVLVAGDAWIAPEAFGQLLQYDKAVLVTAGRGWERIDRDHFWAGAAVCGRRGVSAGADLPDSWDIVSTLLRQLAQDGARRIDVDTDDKLPAPVRVDSEEIARRTERMALSRNEAPHWLDRFVTHPIASGLLGFVRKQIRWRKPLGWLPVAVGLLGTIAGYLGAVAGVGAAALAALVLERALRRIDPDWHPGEAAEWRSGFTFALVGASLLLLSRRGDIGWIPCAALLLSAAVCATADLDDRWRAIVPNLPVTALILLVLSLALGPMAIDYTVLACLATLTAERWASFRARRTALKRN